VRNGIAFLFDRYLSFSQLLKQRQYASHSIRDVCIIRAGACSGAQQRWESSTSSCSAAERPAALADWSLDIVMSYTTTTSTYSVAASTQRRPRDRLVHVAWLGVERSGCWLLTQLRQAVTKAKWLVSRASDVWSVARTLMFSWTQLGLKSAASANERARISCNSWHESHESDQSSDISAEELLKIRKEFIHLGYCVLVEEFLTRDIHVPVIISHLLLQRSSQISFVFLPLVISRVRPYWRSCLYYSVVSVCRSVAYL